MPFILPYLPHLATMSPSIAIAVVYLTLTLCVSIFFSMDGSNDFDRMYIMAVLTGAIFAISISIGKVINSDIPEIFAPGTIENLSIHEEFLVALTVEMIGAIIFIPAIYGSDTQSNPIYMSLGFSLFFLILFFVFPIAIVSKIAFTASPQIIDSYVDNLRVELLSLIVLFVGYTLLKLSTLKRSEVRRKTSRRLIMMVAIIVIFLALFRHVILDPQYENLYLALGAAGLSVFILAIAKAHQGLLIAIIILSIGLTIVLLTGTQLENFRFDTPTSINLVAELIGAITVALMLDTDMDV